MYRIALDFDGVFHACEGEWTFASVIDEKPLDGAREFCELLLDKGFSVVIFSCRGDMGGVDAIKAWLKKYDFPNIAVSSGCKPSADIYVDDRGYRFDGDFGRLLRFLLDPEKVKEWHRE